MRIVSYTILSLFFFLALIVGVLESGPGKILAQKIFQSALARSGIQVETGSLSGRFPQELHLTQVEVKGVAGKNISIDTLDVDISLLRLLKKELCITRLAADGIRYTDAEPNSAAPSKRSSFTLNVESFSLTHLELPEEVNVTGRLKIKPKTAFIHFTATRPDFPDAGVEVTAFERRDGELELHVDLATPTLAAVKPWIAVDAEGPLALQFYAKGRLDAFTGKFSGKFDAKQLPIDELNNKEWTFRGKFHKKKNGQLFLRNLLASLRNLRLKGSAELSDSYAFEHARIQLQTELHGRLFATADVTKTDTGFLVDATGKMEKLTVEPYTAENLRAAFKGRLVDRAFKGEANLSAHFLGADWELSSPISYRKEDAIQLEKISVSSPLLHAVGDLVYRSDELFVGTIDASKIDLQIIRRLYPEIDLYGQASGHLILNANEAQTLHLQLDGQEVYLGPAYASSSSLTLDWEPNYKIALSAALGCAKYEQFFIDSATFETIPQNGTHPFHLRVNGTLKDPMNGSIDGAWKIENGALDVMVRNGSGQMLGYPVQLSNPTSIRWSPTSFSCSQFALSIADATASIEIDAKPDNIDAQILLDRIPLDFLSINPLNVAVTGRMSLNAAFKERNRLVQGEIAAQIEDLKVQVPGEYGALLAFGELRGKFDRERLQLKGGLEVRNHPLLSLDLDLPIHFHLWPLEVAPLKEKDAFAHVVFDGRIEDFLDFFNLGTHRFEGHCNTDMTLRGTLAAPRLDGHCAIEHGRYENYYTGTELIDCKALIDAEGKNVLLRSFTAQDVPKTGKLEATGTLSLADPFPFHIDAVLDRLHVAQIDFVAAQATGLLNLTGDLHSAQANGKVEIVQCNMTIPDALTQQPPDLAVLYKNAPHPIAHSPESTNHYPLLLNLDVSAPKNVTIKGRGLESEWKGNFHLGGTFTSIAPKGKLELVSGQFVFASRSFNLTEGALSFLGKEREMPHLDIAGEMSEKGVAITARLRGPLNRPQLTFRSTPPLPLNSILSYLLFGEDISDLDGFQALQLAATVASLAGQGPDILETTRKTLGVDRLRLVSTPSSDDESSDTLAIQIGKYVAKGVIVSVTQGAEDSSTNISIEVDIGAGFFFQAESQQLQEQGKFSLKWNRNY